MFKTPESHGSAIHPLLLSLYYTSPSLVSAVASSNTDDTTISHAIKAAWTSLQSSPSPSAKAIWDLVGRDKLIPADCAELTSQICDLVDAELANAAEKSLNVSSKIVIHSGARVKDGNVQKSYMLALSMPITGTGEGSDLVSLLKSNFSSETIDYMFPDDVEPVASSKTTKLASKFGECLIIQLQRYRYDFSSLSNAKIYDRVDIPVHISGNEFSAYADSAFAASIGGCSMDLVAVVTHSSEKGYGLLLRPNAKGAWFKCCDPDLNDVPTETSLESVFGGDIDSECAYMLFYKVSVGDGITGMARKMSRLSVKAAGAVGAAAAAPAAKKAEGGGGCCTLS